jgi:hypothetical protein
MSNQILPEDHEQYERDYCDRQYLKHAQGCAYSFKALAILIVLYFLAMLLTGCTALEPAATKSTGTVIHVQGPSVWVLFDVVNRKAGDKASNWFYIPGHQYAEGDFYPDPYKDPELEKLILSPKPPLLPF